MNALANAIQSENLTGTAAEIVAAFGATVDLSPDATSYSLAGVADKLFAAGVDPVILIDLRSHIASLPIGGATLEGLLLTGGGAAGGVNFSLPAIRYQLQANQAQQSTTAAQQAILAGLLLIGVPRQTRWAKCGLNALPSEAAVTTALEKIADREWGLAAIALINTGLANGDGKAAIKSQIAGT